MRLTNYVAHDLTGLITEIPFEQYENDAQLLIQIFCGSTVDDLRQCSKIISKRLPKAVVIGATSEGQIHDSQVKTKSIVASFACFEKTRLAVATASDTNDFSHGRDIANRIARDAETRLIILLSDGSYTNGERLLAGIDSVGTVPVAGGMASDNAFNRTAILHGDKIIKHGAVGVALISHELTIKTNYAFSWFPIGKEFWVTRSEGNRVYTIGNLTSVEFYQKYLGKAVAEQLPATGIEYPLIMMRDGMPIARACLNKLDDGSLIFAGDVPTGAKVSLSYGDTELILKESAQRTTDLHQCEAVFFYSCMARRRFLGDGARKELTWSHKLASAGFFTYGEFFSNNGKNNLLNETLTMVGLGEHTLDTDAHRYPALNYRQETHPSTIDSGQPSTIQVLSHYTHAITNDCGRMISLVNQAGVAITEWVETDDAWLPVYLSEAFETLTGYTAESFVLGHISLLSIVYPDDQGMVIHAARRARTHSDTLKDVRFRIVRKDGFTLFVHAHMAGVEASSFDMKKSTLVATLQDITAQHELLKEKELASYHATHDMLTDLYNRGYLRDQLAASVRRLQHRKGFGALIFIDLDHFKQINDSRGHQIGDEVLIETAERLRRHIRADDIPCRLGGDEFVILEGRLADSLSEAGHNATRIAEKLLGVIKAPYKIPPNELYISASIGIAMFDGSESPENLMRFADNAMYQAKESGKDTYRFFDHALQNEMEKRIAIQNRLHHAVETGNFSLVYQPQTETEPDQRIVGVEALIRWQDEELGIVPPSSLIAIAEASGLIVPIGYWVFRQAARQILAWRNHPEKSSWRISINISGKQFQQPDFVSRIKTIAQEEGITPDRIRLELTESLLVSNAQSSQATIEQLIGAGFSLSIDDFGTGYSSLSYLKLLPVRELKIDRSFIRDIAIDPSDKAIVATIISIAHQFELDVIAEGVETQEQVDILHSLGCSLFQGYFFSKPVSADLL